MQRKQQKHRTQQGAVAVAEEEEDTEEIKDIKAAEETDIKVDSETRTWRTVMEMPKPTVRTAMSPHIMQFSAALHIVSKRR